MTSEAVEEVADVSRGGASLRQRACAAIAPPHDVSQIENEIDIGALRRGRAFAYGSVIPNIRESASI
jgi:hypothetical protein